MNKKWETNQKTENTRVTGIWKGFTSELNQTVMRKCGKSLRELCSNSFIHLKKKKETGRRNQKGEDEELRRDGYKRGKWGMKLAPELLRRQGIFELHARDIVIQRHRHHLLHGADQAVLLAAVLNHQGVWLVGVEHDVVGCHDQHAPHHSLR